MWRLLLVFLVSVAAESPDTDGETSRKVLGSSVVTSVSVILDTGNGSKVFADAAGKPVAKPMVASDLASPIDLLNPDRYEFYTFDDSGDLVKRLMTLEEIQDIIATGDGDGFNIDLSSNGFLPEKRVNEVVNNVQNVLKEEMKIHKNNPQKPQYDTPDVSDSWSMILPAVFGNSGEDIKPEPPITHVTPDTIMIEPTVSTTTEQISTVEKVMTLGTRRPTTTTTSTEPPQMINVEIISNSNSTTEKTTLNDMTDSSPVIAIKPIKPNFDLTDDNTRPIFHVIRKTTKRPLEVQATTYRPTRGSTTVPPKDSIAESSTLSEFLASIRTSTSSTSTTPQFITFRHTDGTTASTATPFTTRVVPKITSQSTRRTTTTPTTTSTTTRRTTTPTTTTPTTTRMTTTPTTTRTTTTPTTTTPTTTTSTTTTPATTTTVVPTTTITTEAPTTTPEEVTNVRTTTWFDTTTATPTTVPIETTSILSTTEESNEDALTTTRIPESSLPTLLEILSNYQTQTTYNPVTTTTEPTTTLGSLSTFFIVSDNKRPSINSDESSTLFSSTINQDNDDLSTLSTQYVTVKTISSNQSRIRTTTEPQAITEGTTLDLDQYLLSSTNIYEINSELSDLAGQSTTNSEEVLTPIENTTTERLFVKIEEPVVSTTTDQSLIQSIEQLMAQAANTVEPPILSDNEALKIEQMIKDSGNKPMSQVVQVAGTLASNLVGEDERFESTTTEKSFIEEESSLLSDSLESLLSQISDTASTTVITTTLPESTTEVPTERNTEKTEDYVPHIINITVIRNQNQSKPAKADLSLEMEYEDIINELRMNSSLTNVSTDNIQDVTETEEISTEDESEISTTLSTTTKNEELSTILSYSTEGIDLDLTTEGTTESNLDISTVGNSAATTLQNVEDSTPTTSEVPILDRVPEVRPSVVVTINEKPVQNSPPNNTWTLVPTMAPHNQTTSEPQSTHEPAIPVDLIPKPLQGFGLEDSTARLDSDIYQFVQLCNELSFGFWKSVTSSLSTSRSVMVSPFAATSLLAMVFLGARGATSGEMNEILRLDDMVTFNPHLIFKNVSESIEMNADSGVAASAIVRELYSDRSKGKLLGFYKERVRQFYDGHVEEVGFREIGDVIRRRTNLLVKKNTDGKIPEFLKETGIFPKPPLAGVSVSVFQTDCSQGSTSGRDGELHFVVLPSIRQRRLIPIPATVYRSGFLAGYEPSLDATAAALGTKDQTISTIFIIPGQQGMSAPGDGLARLEKHLVESSFHKGAWSRLLRSLIPRPGLELQIPRFQHRSFLNSTESLKRMGLHDLFDARKADLKGLNGAAHDFHLSDVLQINEFATCGEDRIGDTHHIETYPTSGERRARLVGRTDWEEPRDYQRAFHDPLHDPSYLSLPLPLRPRQARLPEAPRLRFDRPFLYVVRHNPSGLILHMGRFHPRLLP